MQPSDVVVVVLLVVVVVVVVVAPPATGNQDCVTEEVRKKSSSLPQTFWTAEVAGCVPSLWKSAQTQVSPSARAVVPSAQR